jgi:hypothetical protein
MRFDRHASAGCALSIGLEKALGARR